MGNSGRILEGKGTAGGNPKLECRNPKGNEGEPQMNADERRLGQDEMSQLTETVIRCAFAVSNTRGRGFLEKVYENALAHELRKAGLKVEQQHAITVHYDGVVVGEYAADLLARAFF